MSPADIAAVADKLRQLADSYHSLALAPHQLPKAVQGLHERLGAVYAASKAIAHPTATGCHRHPAGPVDPDPPPGWGRCELCNIGRRRAQASMGMGRRMLT